MTRLRPGPVRELVKMPNRPGLHEEDLAALNALATSTDRSRDSLIREAVSDLLIKYGFKKESQVE